MDRTPTLLDDVYEGEVEDITFPCARALKAGESIADASVQCLWDHGIADATPSGRIATPRQIVGSDVIQRFSSPVAGAWYRLIGTVTLSSGRVLVGVGLVYGKPKTSTS